MVSKHFSDCLVLRMSFSLSSTLAFRENFGLCFHKPYINDYRLNNILACIFFEVFLKRQICRHEGKEKNKNVFRIKGKLASWQFHLKAIVNCSPSKCSCLQFPGIPFLYHDNSFLIT